ncbi:uncharacterized protein LOC122020048 [Zingiber officinale]|uniref:uncharacterized protein LOC122020048 n=1 Tax=Zingiber officinale TaxID=94328 RepID=UPI001C4AD99F|nr:uncharacterized protein LOC122020048 [Zingiber officinale]
MPASLAPCRYPSRPENLECLALEESKSTMQQRSRQRCREVSPAAAEFGLRRASVSPAPPEGHYGFKKQLNETCTASGFGRNISFLAEEHSLDNRIKKSPCKKTSEVLIKDLIEEELSKGKETKHSSPSLIAKLMGLDSCPSLVKQKRNTNIPGLFGNYVDAEDLMQWKHKDSQELKEVFEISNANTRRKQASHSDMMAKHRQRAYEDYVRNEREDFMDVSGQSPIELFHKYKEFSGTFGISDSSKDLFWELLQDSNSLFAKHLQDLKYAPSSHRSKIAILKPSECRTENGRDKVQCRSSKTGKSNDRLAHMHQEITGSSKTHAARLRKCHVEEDTGSVPYNLLALQRGRSRSRTAVRPADIVILKPTLEKAQKVAEASFLTHGDLWFNSKKDRKLAALRTQEFHDQKHIDIFPHEKDGMDHKVNYSEENYRKITPKMRHNRNRLSKLNFSPRVTVYTGDRYSIMMPDIAKLTHSDSVPQSPDPFGEWGNRFIPSSMYSTKSRVSMEDLNHHYFERRNVTHQLQNMGLISQRSSTPGETLELSEEVTGKFTVDFLNSKNISTEYLSRDEILDSWSCQFGTSCKDAPRDGCSRFSSRPNSHLASVSAKFGDRKRVGGSTTIIKDVADVKSYVSLGILSAKQSEHQNYNYQLADYVAVKNMVPEREIHINSEGLRKRVHEEDLITKTELNTATKVLTTWEEQATKSAFHVPPDNGYGYHKDIVLQEKSSDHIVKLQPLSFNDLEQPSPVSVLETPYEDETYSSGCFGRLSADLKELRMQLEHLKMDSAAICTEESQVLLLSDEYCKEDDCVFLPLVDLHEARFRDIDDRDFTYLLDILLESGTKSIHDNKLLKEHCLFGFALDQSLFVDLEKKYGGISSWSRSERRLLFDLVNYSLADLVTSYLDVHPGITISKLRLPTYDSESIVEAVWQMVVKQRKELQCSQENKILETAWLGWRYDVDVIAIDIEEMLNADLLQELVSELL